MHEISDNVLITELMIHKIITIKSINNNRVPTSTESTSRNNSVSQYFDKNERHSFTAAVSLKPINNYKDIGNTHKYFSGFCRSTKL